MKSRSPCLVTVETWRICRLDTGSSVGRMRSPLRPKARPAEGSALALWTESGRAANWLGLLRAAMRAPPIRKVEARPVRIVPQSQRMLTLRRTGVSSSSPTRSGGSVPRSTVSPRAPMFRPVRPLTFRQSPRSTRFRQRLPERPPQTMAGWRPVSSWTAAKAKRSSPAPRPEPYFSLSAVFGTNKARLTTLYGVCEYGVSPARLGRRDASDLPAHFFLFRVLTAGKAHHYISHHARGSAERHWITFAFSARSPWDGTSPRRRSHVARWIGESRSERRSVCRVV